MKKVINILIAISTFLFSCQNAPVSPQQQNQNQYPYVCGVFTTSNSRGDNGYVSSGYTAVFKGTTGSNLNAGSVSANGFGLTYSADYTLFQSNSLIYGTTNWSVSGSVSNGISQINYSSKPMPTPSNPSFSPISKSAMYSISLSMPVQADSIIYTIHCNSPYVTIKKSQTGSSSGISFTTSELSMISSGSTCAVSVVCKNQSESMFGNNKYQFISQDIIGSSVAVTN